MCAMKRHLLQYDKKEHYILDSRFLIFVCLFGLRLYVPVNNFSVMSGRSHRFLGITSTFWEVNVSCSRIQQGFDPHSGRHVVRSPMLDH